MSLKDPCAWWTIFFLFFFVFAGFSSEINLIWTQEDLTVPVASDVLEQTRWWVGHCWKA